MRTALVLMTCLFAVVPATAQTALPLDRPAPAPSSPVVAVSYAWAGAWSAKDVDALMALYAPEPVFLSNSGERWSGTEEIRSNFAFGLSSFTPTLTLHSVRSQTSGKLGYDSGTYDQVVAGADTSKTTRVQGNYLFVFQRQKSGEWKILEQTFTQYDPKKI